jgi:UDP-N-acetylglucosamine--N-acetylmuramyl-(pentapeptide) pyrophosphoryl-undecaprenol N-acetylglucosamine transferase
MARVVLAGGGTGGHIFPMSAVARALMDAGLPASDLVYVGSRRGQERSLLGGGSVRLVTLPGRGLRRSLSARALVENGGALVGLALGTLRALWLFARWRPAVVVSFGGYAALPAGLAAVLWRRRLVLVELDAAAGATHRLLARFASARCVPGEARSARDVVTGVPLTPEILSVSRERDARRAARARFAPPIDDERVVVVVMTGSLGARSVNDAVSALALSWRSRRDVCLLHVSGRRDAARVREAAPALEGLDYRVFDFAEMAPLWSVADIALCRAGAMTVAELAALGIAAVLVPLPGAPGGHQELNARRLVNAGGAILLNDADLSEARLAESLDELMHERRYEEMGRSLAPLAHRDAAGVIADVVRRVGGLA